MTLVDAVVDDPDLHPLARGRQPGAPEGRRADGGRASVELGPVARAPVHGGDAVDLLQPSHGVGGDNDRKRVQDDPVTPADLRARDGVGDPAGDLLLLDAQARQPAKRRPGVQVEPPLRARKLRAGGGRRRELDDDLHESAVGDRCGTARGGKRRQRRQEQDPEENGTSQTQHGT